MSSGIYKITCGRKMYIGSSSCISNRLRKHKSLLRLHKHDNAKLQAAWNKYGESSFVFEVLEFVNDTNKLLHYEQIWLNILFTSLDERTEVLNILKIAGNTVGRKHTAESKHNISIGRSGISPNRNKEEYSKAQSLAQKLSHAARFGFYAFMSPNGAVYENILDLQLFCDLHELNISNMRAVYRGKRKHHKGWIKYEQQTQDK